jgi:RNA polymerase sigma-70 factor, ECF subfamily
VTHASITSIRERVTELDASMAPDDALVRQFEQDLNAASTLAFRVAYSVLRQREDAEDVAQEALVKAYRNLRQLRDPARLRAWLVRTTWRLALDWRRAGRRRDAREAVHVAEWMQEQSVREAGEEEERAARLWRAIDALPEKLRVTVVLAAIEEHDVAAVGRLLELPAGTVKSRLFAARQRLKKFLTCESSTTTNS